jgi:hypothetical protein
MILSPVSTSGSTKEQQTRNFPKRKGQEWKRELDKDEMS